MDWYPLWNSLRIAAIATVVIFFLGIWAAYYIARLPRLAKGVLDVVLTLPLVLPPTVVGYLLLLLLGPNHPLGAWFLKTFGEKLVMRWQSAIAATMPPAKASSDCSSASASTARNTRHSIRQGPMCSNTSSGATTRGCGEGPPGRI